MGGFPDLCKLSVGVPPVVASGARLKKLTRAQTLSAKRTLRGKQSYAVGFTRTGLSALSELALGYSP